jgi:asparagine synthase (glutamine-hydrolysing)
MLNGKIISKGYQYWTPLNQPSIKGSPSIKNMINKAVIDHTVSDVPVGLFYSGGIDSTLILTELNNKIDPFIVARSKDSYKNSGFVDDSYYADEIAKKLKIKLNKIHLDKELNKESNFLEQIEDIAKGVEEPIADFTFTSTEVLSRKVKEKGYTVMLSGLGADEIFGGYPRYKLVKYSKVFKFIAPIINNTIGKKKSFEKKLDRFNRFFNEKQFELKYTSLIGSFSANEVKKMIPSNVNRVQSYVSKLQQILNETTGLSDMKKAMYLDWLGFLSHNFIVADKSSMRQSVEIRVPLATKDLYEKVFFRKRQAYVFV